MPLIKPVLKTAPSLVIAVFITALGLITAGCGSVSQSGSASFASVEIKGRTEAQIRQAAVAVFQQDGYAPLKLVATGYVFQKEGSRKDKAAYGNWVDGPPVYVRVKVERVVVSPGVDRLQCNAYMVRNQGDSTMEEEVKLSNIRRHPYQDLLNQVAKKLK